MEKIIDEEKTRVENEIGLVRQMCAQMGNNDSEFSLLDNIWNEYINGELTAEKAIESAQAIPAGKVER